jgi:hypothetical protein
MLPDIHGQDWNLRETSDQGLAHDLAISTNSILVFATRLASQGTGVVKVNAS